MAADKGTARKAARVLLRAISAEKAASQSAKVCALVATLPAVQSSRGLSVYLPMVGGREVDTWDLVRRYLGENGSGKHSVFVPKTYGDGEMRMLRAASLAELQALPPNHWGIPEHTDASASHLEDGGSTGNIDVVIVPALLYSSKTLYRLGRGKGFYDRFLAQLDRARRDRGLPPAVKVGIGFSEQIVEHVPTDAHDIPMDYVVGPHGVHSMAALN